MTDDGTLALLTQIKKAVAPAASVAAPSNEIFIPTPNFMPPGLTLAATYTASASGLSWGTNKYVWVLACSGGGSGGWPNFTNAAADGGDSGWLLMGWMLASALTSVTIGAAGAQPSGQGAVGNKGGDTRLGTAITIPGGNGGLFSANSSDLLYRTNGGLLMAFPNGIATPGKTAFGKGGAGGALPAIGPLTSVGGTGSSGGSSSGVVAGSGYGAGGGGGSYGSSAGAAGGAATQGVAYVYTPTAA